MTLAIASASSVAAAVVVSHVWGAGTLFGAAVTPIIVALVSEGLHRPQRVLKTVRETRTFDPLAEGRRGLEEGDFHAARLPESANGAPQRTVHRVEPRRVPRRRTLAVALATGLVAFAIGAFLLTGADLVFGDSAGSGSSRTTLFGGGKPAASSTTKTGEEQTTDTQQTTTGEQQTTTTDEQGTTSERQGPGATTPAPTTPDTPTTTAPGGATQQSQPAPAPQGEAPAGPATTTPSTTPAP